MMVSVNMMPQHVEIQNEPGLTDTDDAARPHLRGHKSRHECLIAFGPEYLARALANDCDGHLHNQQTQPWKSPSL